VHISHISRAAAARTRHRLAAAAGRGGAQQRVAQGQLPRLQPLAAVLRREHVPRRASALAALRPGELGELGEARGGRPERRGQQGVAALVQQLESHAERLGEGG